MGRVAHFDNDSPLTARYMRLAIPYVKEEQAQAATKDPYLKLVLRLIDCHVLDLGECSDYSINMQYYVLIHLIQTLKSWSGFSLLL